MVTPHSRFGLIGHPIARSLSPGLFRAAYDGKYPYELIQGEDFEVSYQRFLEEYDGINVTAPFKELAYAKTDIRSEECRLARAANLLVKTPEGIKAYNSDLLGVRLWLQECTDGVDTKKNCIQEMTALIVGTGGAGRAAAAAAVTLGLKVILMNRNIERAEKLAEDLMSMGYETTVRALEDFRECFREADIIIYNIPTRIPELDTLTDSDFATGNPKFTLEANYKDPSFDENLIKRMTQANPLARHSGGRTWLLYQAWTGYEIFTGERPDLQRMSDVL